MAKITFTFTPPLNDVTAKWQQLANSGFYESIASLGREVGDIVEEAVKSEAPVLTGASRETIHQSQYASGSGIRIDIRGNDILAMQVSGTAPHVIEPTSASVLAFMGSDGKMVFTKIVHHPGTKANDFPMRAWEGVRSEAISILSRIGSEVAAKIQ